MRLAAALLTLAALAACSQDREVSAPSPEEATVSDEGSEPPAYPALDSLVGEYRVAGIDGQPIDQPYGIALSIGENRISFSPECAGFVWTYEYAADGTLSTERHPDYGGEVAPGGSVAKCAGGLRPTDIPLAQAIDDRRCHPRRADTRKCDSPVGRWPQRYPVLAIGIAAR